MLKNGIPADEIPNFQDPKYWLYYFPPLGMQDLRKFGLPADWRRSFITTDVNPFYDSFIRWQFNTLKARGKLGFGKRPTIFSPIDGQACADHDRASGEGVVPQEYTLIKIKLKDVPEGHKGGDNGHLDIVKSLLAEGRNVYFVAATLRPETMYGQTNCFLLPEGEYGLFDVTTEDQTAKGEKGDVFICSERSANNMAYQGLSAQYGKTFPLGSVIGEHLLGLPVQAPYSQYETVYTLPMLTISMKKGTGVVTSVPSDSADDWAAYRDLKDKPKLREKYNLTDDMTNLDVIEIIDIPGFGKRAAVTVVDQLKIKSQNDSALLKQAKEMTYTAGFYQGVMLVGKYAGKKVNEAKELVRKDMIAENLAAPYFEPENIVISRSGDECVVAYLDQWYLKYGEEEWKAAVQQWIRSGKFETYTPAIAGAFEHTLAWLQEWACSRSFGLGTALPWDPQFVIESLSDSTIYMAYYTIAHLLHQGSLDGQGKGPLGITPADMDDKVWDYIFLETEYPSDGSISIPKESLDKLRKEFQYWYPMDLRVSGKDLIQNHLTMSLYNHAAIWFDEAAKKARDDRMPQSFYCNGHVLVDGEKMSKSQGNFIMLHEAIAKWSADATRFALADAGDSLEDANFEQDIADNTILRLTNEEEYAKECMARIQDGSFRTGEFNFADRVFENRINQSIVDSDKHYQMMRFREALKTAFYELQLARDTYRDMCAKMDILPHTDLIKRFLDVQFVILSPICPHFCDFVWGKHLGNWKDEQSTVLKQPWPTPGPVNPSLLAADDYLSGKIHEFRLDIIKQTTVKASKAAKGFVPQPKPTHAIIYVASGWPDWQKRPLEMLAKMWDVPANGTANNGFPADALAKLKDFIMSDSALKVNMKKIMPLVSNTITSMKDRDTPTEVLSLNVPFDEHAVWTENLEYVKKALELTGEVLVVYNTHPALSEKSEHLKFLDPMTRTKDITPQKSEMRAWAPTEEEWEKVKQVLA